MSVDFVGKIETDRAFIVQYRLLKGIERFGSTHCKRTDTNNASDSKKSGDVRLYEHTKESGMNYSEIEDMQNMEYGK